MIAVDVSRFLTENKKVIDRFAWKVLRRVRAAGLRAADFDDIQQELAIACIKAAKSWNSELGVPFAPYLINGMRMHINRWMENHAYEDCNASLSLDRPLNMEDGGGDLTVLDLVADNAPHADEELEKRQRRAMVIRKLSPRAQMFIEFLSNPPEELIDIFKAMRAKAIYAQKLGVSTFIPAQISEGMVFDLMGASRVERTKLKKEVEYVAYKVAQRVRC